MAIFLLICGFILVPLAAFGPVLYYRLVVRKKTGEETHETVTGTVVKIRHSRTSVSRFTSLFLKLEDGSIKDLDLNSSDVPDIQNLQIGEVATVTYFTTLIGQKLTALSVERKS